MDVGTRPVAIHYSAPHAVVGGKLYLFGGFNGTTSSTQVEEYDVATQTWTTKAPMPFTTAPPRRAWWATRSTCAASDRCRTRVHEYDPASDTWSPRTSMPHPTGAAAAGAVGNKVYVIGGSSGGTATDRVLEYDVLFDTWTVKAAVLPTARFYPSSGVVGGKIVVVGGRDANLGYSLEVDLYDPVADAFTSGSPAPTMSQGSTAVNLSGELVVLCPDVDSTRVDAYDPVSDSWRALPPTPNGHFRGAAGVLDGRIHLVSGYWTPIAYNKLHDVYEPSSPPLQLIRRQ